MMTCHCGRRDGFTLIGGWWVCAACGLPTMGYARTMVDGTIRKNRNGEDEVGLIYFQGGPLDGYAYETETLLGRESVTLPITEYVWTSEKKTSESTGATAQVWRHRGYASTPQAAPAPAPAAVTGVPHPDDATRVDVAANPPAPVSGGDGASSNGHAPAEGEPTKLAAAVGESDLDGEKLMERRKAMKLSRAAVSDRSGLAQSKINAIENSIGKRVKEWEVRKLAETIASFEAERSGAGARA